MSESDQEMAVAQIADGIRAKHSPSDHPLSHGVADDVGGGLKVKFAHGGSPVRTDGLRADAEHLRDTLGAMS